MRVWTEFGAGKGKGVRGKLSWGRVYDHGSGDCLGEREACGCCKPPAVLERVFTGSFHPFSVYIYRGCFLRHDMTKSPLPGV